MRFTPCSTKLHSFASVILNKPPLLEKYHSQCYKSSTSGASCISLTVRIHGVVKQKILHFCQCDFNFTLPLYILLFFVSNSCLAVVCPNWDTDTNSDIYQITQTFISSEIFNFTSFQISWNIFTKPVTHEWIPYWTFFFSFTFPKYTFDKSAAQECNVSDTKRQNSAHYWVKWHESPVVFL